MASKQNCADKLQKSNENATQSHIHYLHNVHRAKYVCQVFFSAMKIRWQHCIINY